MPVETTTTATRTETGRAGADEGLSVARALRDRGATLSVACGSVFTFLGFLTGSARLGDNSLFTHVATGRLLVHGGLGSLWNGMPDPYTTSSGGKSWIVQSW